MATKNKAAVMNVYTSRKARYGNGVYTKAGTQFTEPSTRKPSVHWTLVSGTPYEEPRKV